MTKGSDFRALVVCAPSSRAASATCQPAEDARTRHHHGARFRFRHGADGNRIEVKTLARTVEVQPAHPDQGEHHAAHRAEGAGVGAQVDGELVPRLARDFELDVAAIARPEKPLGTTFRASGNGAARSGLIQLQTRFDTHE